MKQALGISQGKQAVFVCGRPPRAFGAGAQDEGEKPEIAADGQYWLN